MSVVGAGAYYVFKVGMLNFLSWYNKYFVISDETPPRMVMLLPHAIKAIVPVFGHEQCMASAKLKRLLKESAASYQPSLWHAPCCGICCSQKTAQMLFSNIIPKSLESGCHSLRM